MSKFTEELFLPKFVENGLREVEKESEELRARADNLIRGFLDSINNDGEYRIIITDAGYKLKLIEKEK